jgi:hypothetical protein
VIGQLLPQRIAGPLVFIDAKVEIRVASIANGAAVEEEVALTNVVFWSRSQLGPCRCLRAVFPSFAASPTIAVASWSRAAQTDDALSIRNCKSASARHPGLEPRPLASARVEDL